MTQQDTQPPAETLADRALAADILDEVSNLLDHNGVGVVADLIRDGMYDEHEVMGVISRHRLAALIRRAGGDAIPAGEVRMWPVVGPCQTPMWETNRTGGQFADPVAALRCALSLPLPTPKPPAGGDAFMTAALNQNDAMRQELAHVGNLVSDLARAMKVEQANDDGTWPNLAGRVQRLIAAALALPAPVVEGDK